MAFSNASNTSIRTMPKTASTQITISRCEFMATQRVVVGNIYISVGWLNLAFS